MKKLQAQNYVIRNARYMEDAPLTSCYYVRFPRPTSSKTLFSGDTQDLVEKVHNFSKTLEGRKLCKDIDFSDYDFITEQEDEDE